MSSSRSIVGGDCRGEDTLAVADPKQDCQPLPRPCEQTAANSYKSSGSARTADMKTDTRQLEERKCSLSAARNEENSSSIVWKNNGSVFATQASDFTSLQQFPRHSTLVKEIQ